MALKAVKRDKKGWRGEARHRWRRLTLAIVVASLMALLVVALSGFAVARDVGCEGCHPGHVEAFPESTHAGLTCATCHSTSGTTGYVTDGLRAMNWLAASNATTIAPGGFDDVRCLECHPDIYDGVRVSRGIAVSHYDFREAPCLQCHSGVGHAVEGRWYRALEMQDCMACHRTSPTNASSCDVCHVPDQSSERRAGNTVWRATHGAGWKQTHGMGDLKGCIACHAPVYCIDCHGVRVPHQGDWMDVHGKHVVGTGREECETCHKPTWCNECHQLEMPHGDQFLIVHQAEAEDLGEPLCYRCHQKPGCDGCHARSEHSQVPDVSIHEFE